MIILEKGWSQRNLALTYLRNNYQFLPFKNQKCIIYFADDDNSYDIRVFNEYIKNVETTGFWAVG